MSRWIIPDVHGCAKTLRSLIESFLKLTKEDDLYLLGDYIDRGLNSKEVLDYIMDLQGQGYPGQEQPEHEGRPHHPFLGGDPHKTYRGPEIQAAAVRLLARPEKLRQAQQFLREGKELLQIKQHTADPFISLKGSVFYAVIIPVGMADSMPPGAKEDHI